MVRGMRYNQEKMIKFNAKPVVMNISLLQIEYELISNERAKRDLTVFSWRESFLVERKSGL